MDVPGQKALSDATLAREQDVGVTRRHSRRQGTRFFHGEAGVHDRWLTTATGKRWANSRSHVIHGALQVRRHSTTRNRGAPKLTTRLEGQILAGRKCFDVALVAWRFGLVATAVRPFSNGGLTLHKHA